MIKLADFKNGKNIRKNTIYYSNSIIDNFSLPVSFDGSVKVPCIQQ